MTGSVENVSEDGVEYILSSLIDTSKDFVPDKIIDLNFETPSGDIINVQCEVKWFFRAAPDDKDLTLGMKIIDPPYEYKKLIRTLDTGNS